jgi:chloramphenicol 3-O-phosphotransferase
VFVVVITGPPGAGKTTALTALSDALIDDRIAHAAVDADELAWGYPFPSLTRRCEHLRAWRASRRRDCGDLLVVADVIESADHLRDVLRALDADDHLLVRLEAAVPTMRGRIVAREPPGWSGLERLLDESRALGASMKLLDGPQLVLDTERLAPHELVRLIRAARPDRLS